MDEKKNPPDESQAIAKRTPAVITTPTEYRQSMVLWQEQKYHVITPAAHFSGLPPQHGMVAALVQLNPDPDAGDVYHDPLHCRADERAPSKIGLSKLAQAAGMSIRTERTDPRTIPNYWEVRATIRFTGLDGTPQELDAMLEYDLRDGSPRVRNFTPKQIQSARAHGLRGAEARAINAAIRQFGVKQKYTVTELAKPFVAVRVTFQPDMSDPDQRRLVAERAMQGTAALFSGSRQIAAGASHVVEAEVVEEAPKKPAPAATAPPVVVAEAETVADSTPPAKSADEPPTEDAVKIMDVKRHEGTGKNGKPYVRFKITDSHGVEHTTFDEKLREAAEKFKASGQWVEVLTETAGAYKNLVEIAPVGQSPTLPGLDEV